MTLTIIRAAVTVSLFLLFMLLWLWAWNGKRREDFAAAARLPFAESDPQEKPQ
jgi:cbb3-type cytochrome oxidase subunit 3